MSNHDSDIADGELQFDRAVPTGVDTVPAAAGPSITCSACRATIRTEYHSVGGKPVCPPCREAIEREAAPLEEWPPVVRAGLFGLGAAIAGAAIYYGVIAITDLEIGFIAILIGYMVGLSVRKGARGRGGRRLQVLAVALTYLSVALAYLPLAIQGSMEARKAGSAPVVEDTRSAARPGGATGVGAAAPAATAASAQATRANAGTTARKGTSATKDSGPIGWGELLLAVGGLLLFSLVLPVLVIFGSLPSGILSAIIIGVGLRQAWRMTAAPRLDVRGPYRVGAVQVPALVSGPDAAPAS